MVQVELQDREVSVLQQIIDNALEDLHTEIHHTDDHQYKEELRVRQAALERIKDALTHAVV